MLFAESSAFAIFNSMDSLTIVAPMTPAGVSAVAFNIFDFCVAGRERPRRPRTRRAERDRGRQNKTEREFLHVTAPFHFIAPLVHSKPCKSPMSNVQARQQDLGHWTLDGELV